MEEQTSGKYAGHTKHAENIAKSESKDKAVEETAQSGEMTAEETEARLKQMLNRGEIGMSQYNLARQDLLKYGARFEDMPYLFAGKELPLDLTKESRKWYNARLPGDEVVKLLKNPNITAAKLKAIREHYETLPDEEILLEALAQKDDKSFPEFLDDYKTRSNPVVLSIRMDRVEKAVDTIEKKVEEIGTGVGEVKKSVELLKEMFLTMKEREDAQQPENQHAENREVSEVIEQNRKEESGEAGDEEPFSGEYSPYDSIDDHADQGKIPTEEGTIKENSTRQAQPLVKDKPEKTEQTTANDSPEKQEQPAEEEHNSRKEVSGTSLEEPDEAEKGKSDEDSPTEIAQSDSYAKNVVPEIRQNKQQNEENQKIMGREKSETYEETPSRKLPAFFEKLLPGFYHPKKKDYIQLKQRERERQDHLEEMRRMADDLYAQNFLDEETYFIFCELAFKEQALDKETADLLIDGIKRGVPFALLFKVVRNVKSTSDWEASVNLLESLMKYQKLNDERATVGTKT